LNSRSRGTAAAAIASSSAGAVWSAVANAHAVLASPCGMNSRSRGTAAAAIASSSAGAAWSAVANAHAVLASPCGMNSRSRGAAAAAIASSSAGAATVAGRGECPRRVGELLRVKVAQAAAHHRLCHRCKERASLAV